MKEARKRDSVREREKQRPLTRERPLTIMIQQKNRGVGASGLETI
jgi:hypothetical protein